LSLKLAWTSHNERHSSPWHTINDLAKVKSQVHVTLTCALKHHLLLNVIHNLLDLDEMPHHISLSSLKILLLKHNHFPPKYVPVFIISTISLWLFAMFPLSPGLERRKSPEQAPPLVHVCVTLSQRSGGAKRGRTGWTLW